MKNRTINSLLIFFFYSLTLIFPLNGYSQIAGRSFAGYWDTNYGPLLIEISGISLEGKYRYMEHGNKLVEGTISGKISKDGKSVSGIWNQGSTGKFEFILSEDGNFFSGKFWFDSMENQGGEWKGKRKQARVTPVKKLWI